MSCQYRVLFLLLSCTILLAVPTSCSIDTNSNTFKDFMNRVIGTFGKVVPPRKGQFAVLVLVTENQATGKWNEVKFEPKPNTHKGFPFPLKTNEYTRYPFKEKHFVNYIVAIPKPTGNKYIKTHAETQILDYFNSIINSFNKNKQLGAVILYTKLCPCQLCTDDIVNHFKELQEVDKVVVYTIEHWKGVNCGYSRKKFAGVKKLQFVKFP